MPLFLSIKQGLLLNRLDGWEVGLGRSVANPAAGLRLHCLVQRQLTPRNSFQAMVNADFLIAWATTTGSAVTWTLSHRNSPGEQEPVLAASNTELSSNRFFTLVPSLSTSTASSPYTVVTYLRLLRQPSNYPSTSPFKTIARRQTPFIFASCSVNPRNAAEGAHLQQHDQVSFRFLCIASLVLPLILLWLS